MSVRDGPRAVEQLRNREIEATRAEIWSEALTAVWETDPEVIAAVLPPPLAPVDGEPLVRCTITTVQMPVGPAFGAGWLGVRARHGDVLGEYPIFMPMTTEQSVIGGRETYGEPKKIADVRSTRSADGAVEGVIARMGFTLVEVRGRVNETRENYERDEARLLVQVPSRREWQRPRGRRLARLRQQDREVARRTKASTGK